MPSGEVTDPRSKDGFLKTGYLNRLDAYKENGSPYSIPFINDKNFKKNDAVFFDVVTFDITYENVIYKIPVAVINQEIEKDEWDDEWETADIIAKGKQANESDNHTKETYQKSIEKIAVLKLDYLKFKDQKII